LETTPKPLQFASVITLEEWFAGRILSIDRSVSIRWAELLVDRAGRGRPLPAIDSLLAATAR